MVPGARVTLTRKETGTRRNVLSDAEGHLTIPLLEPGTYTLRRAGGIQGRHQYLLYPSDSANYRFTVLHPSKVDNYSLRLDHLLNSKITVFGRFNVAPSSNKTYSVASQTDTQVNTQTYTFGAVANVSTKILNEFRANYSINGGNSIPDP